MSVKRIFLHIPSVSSFDLYGVFLVAKLGKSSYFGMYTRMPMERNEVEY